MLYFILVATEPCICSTFVEVLSESISIRVSILEVCSFMFLLCSFILMNYHMLVYFQRILLCFMLTCMEPFSCSTLLRRSMPFMLFIFCGVWFVLRACAQ